MNRALCFVLLLGCGAGVDTSETRSDPAATTGWEAVAGYGIREEARPQPGIITAGQPTAEQLADATTHGVGMVISLRVEGEDGQTWEADAMAESGARFERIPMAGAEGLTEDNARRLAELLEQAEGEVLVHCGSSNRVGALLALKAFYVDGISAERSVQMGQEAGLTRLEPAVVAHLQEVCAALSGDPRC